LLQRSPVTLSYKRHTRSKRRPTYVERMQEFCTEITLHTARFNQKFNKILSRISGLCPGSHTCPWEKHLDSQIIFIYLKWFKTWNNFGKSFASERVEAAHIARNIFVIYSYLKSCIWLSLVAGTLPSVLHAREIFQKWN